MSGYRQLKTAGELEMGCHLSASHVQELMDFITECDGVECTKHDVIVRGAVRRAEELEKQVATLKVQLSEEYKDWMREKCNADCRMAELQYNQIVPELRGKIAELEAEVQELNRRLGETRDECAQAIFDRDEARHNVAALEEAVAENGGWAPTKEELRQEPWRECE